MAPGDMAELTKASIQITDKPLLLIFLQETTTGSRAMTTSNLTADQQQTPMNWERAGRSLTTGQSEFSPLVKKIMKMKVIKIDSNQ